MRKIFINIGSIVLYINLLLADYSNEPYFDYKLNKNYAPIKITSDQIITIDGILNEPLWKSINILNGLEQAEPKINGRPSKETDVKICYDDENLYLAVFLYQDSSNISYKSGNYDDFLGVFDSASDYFIIELDTDHDHDTGYGFAINSSGVKADYMIYDDNFFDDNWNAQWEVVVSNSKKGWSFECRIPFKSLRLNSGENLTWGMNIVRYIKYINEYISWVVIPTEKVGIVSKYGHLNSLSIKHQKTIQFNSYALSGYRKYNDKYFAIIEEINPNVPGMKTISLASTPSIYKENFIYDNMGFDFKYSISSNAAVDFTYNPDFEQINQDPSEVNNTPYETFFEEKRNFFLEDALFFNTPIKIFYSRRIGGTEKYNENDNFAIFQTKLNHASKYTLKNNKLNLGLMVAQSEPLDIRQVSESDIDKLYSIQSSVLRLSHILFNNKSKVGFIVTDYKTKYKTVNVYGYDYSFSLINDQLFIDGQRITSKENANIGFGNNLEIGYRSNIFSFVNKHLYIDLWYTNNEYDENLKINDLGYLFRNNLKEQNIGITINDDKDIIKSRYILQHYIAKSYSNDILSDIISFNYDITFKNLSYLNFGYSKENEYFKDKFYDDYFDLDLNKIVKSPPASTFSILYGNNFLEYIEYSLLVKNSSNKIDDKGKQYIAQILLKPKNWIQLDLSYDRSTYFETYHFLKLRLSEIGGSSCGGICGGGTEGLVYSQRTIENPFQYVFTNSDNKEVSYTAQFSSYLNNVTIQLYAEYFSYENIWNNSNEYYIVDENFENYNYPEFYTGQDQLVEEDDKFLYTSLYSSAVANFVIKWNFMNNSNLYFLYSINKSIYGIEINSLKELLDFKHENISQNSIGDILYDKSLFIKCEFYFNK